jgi:hypothetical protein
VLYVALLVTRLLLHKQLGLPHPATSGEGLRGGSGLNANSGGINSGVGGGRALELADDDNTPETEVMVSTTTEAPVPEP